jgi:putative ABC transport system permease protein
LWRNFGRSPAASVTAVLTLSLTLGLGASIFAVVDAVLLRPAPFADPKALVTLGEILPGDSVTAARSVRYGTLEGWRERAGSLAAIEASDATHLTLTGLGPAEQLHVTNVTPGFLPLLGIGPAVGRPFEVADLSQRVVILTHALWRAKLGADPSWIGRAIVLGGEPHTVVGVLPDTFAYPLDQVDLFRPLPLPPPDPANPGARAGFQVGVIARLASEISPTDLTEILDEISQRSSPPARVVATPMADVVARGSASTLRLLAGAAALACLVAFANLAGLLLVRSIDRRRELAVRTALGASPALLARQMTLEATTLVSIGVASGILVAWWITPVVGRLALEQFGALAGRELSLSWRVTGIVTILALAAGGLCGLLPAYIASRHGVAGVLARGVTAAPREIGLRRAFVTSVVTMACVLLVCLSLIGRSLWTVLGVDPGFDPRGVLTVAVPVTSTTKYAGADRLAIFFASLHRALEQRFGPGTVSVVNELPLTHDRGRGAVRLHPADSPVEVVRREIGPSYFDVMRIPIVAGRALDARDDASAPLRVVVSESLAVGLFAGDPPVGRQIRLGPEGRTVAEIVGVAGDVKHASLDADGFWPTMYVSAWRSPSRSMVLVIRAQRPDAQVTTAVREEVAQLDSDVPVRLVRTMEQVAASSPGVPARRVLVAAFTSFALLAIGLVALGLFGVVAHDVAARRRELALRLALGADPRRILLKTVGQAISMVGTGLVPGGILSLWATRAFGTVVVETSQFDPGDVLLAALVLMVVGALAVLPTAQRAARTDPLAALLAD